MNSNFFCSIFFFPATSGQLATIIMKCFPSFTFVQVLGLEPTLHRTQLHKYNLPTQLVILNMQLQLQYIYLLLSPSCIYNMTVAIASRHACLVRHSQFAIAMYIRHSQLALIILKYEKVQLICLHWFCHARSRICMYVLCKLMLIQLLNIEICVGGSKSKSVPIKYSYKVQSVFYLAKQYS